MKRERDFQKISIFFVKRDPLIHTVRITTSHHILCLEREREREIKKRVVKRKKGVIERKIERE